MSLRTTIGVESSSARGESRLQRVLKIGERHVETTTKDTSPVNTGDRYDDLLISQNRGLRPGLHVRPNLNYIQTMTRRFRERRVLTVPLLKQPTGFQPTEKWFAELAVGSAVSLSRTVKRLIETRTARVISSGSFNNAYSIDTMSLQDPSTGTTGGYLQSTRQQKLLLRVSQSNELVDVTIHRVLMELLIGNFASQYDIGPKMYCVWCTPKDPELSGWHPDHQFTNVATAVNSLTEMYDGDLSHPDLAADQVSTHGMFWPAVARCVVRACQYGLFHGDLKPANMLWKKVLSRDGSSYLYEVRYTDFDPFFVTLLDMKTEEMQNISLCMAFLSMHMLLAKISCEHMSRSIATASSPMDIEDVFRGDETDDRDELRTLRDESWETKRALAMAALEAAIHEVLTPDQFRRFAAWNCNIDGQFVGIHDVQVRDQLKHHLRIWSQWYMDPLKIQGCDIPSNHIIVEDDVSLTVMARDIVEFVARS